MTIIEWRELVDAGIIRIDEDGNEICTAAEEKKVKE
jgi:hypothetical protein